MQYQILGKTVPAVEVTLNKGESMYTQSGGMSWQTPGISMATNARGGLMKSLGRMFAGESIFMSSYTAEVDDAKVAFATTVPGEIKAINLSEMPNDIMLQKGAFICAEPSVELNIAFSKRFTAGLLGGEGFILQKAQGKGMLFLEIDGDPIEKELAPGEVLKVDTGNVVAFEPKVSYEIETVKGLGNIFLGGEGLFLTKLVGPGRVILQSQNIKDFVGSPEIARKSSAIINVSQYSFIFSLSPNDMTDLCTLYEKAGQINENEAENIVNLPRGSAFLITGPANRTNIRIVATPHVKNTFEN